MHDWVWVQVFSADVILWDWFNSEYLKHFSKIFRQQFFWARGPSSQHSLRFCEFHFSRATTNSGAHKRARLISLAGKLQMALRASSAYCMARALAASREP